MNLKEASKMAQESKVGQKLSDMTTMKMIIIILAMLFSVPPFDASTYISAPNTYGYDLTLLKNFTVNSTGFNYTFNYIVQEELKLSTPILYLEAQNVTWQSGTDVTYPSIQIIYSIG